VAPTNRLPGRSRLGGLCHDTRHPGAAQLSGKPALLRPSRRCRSVGSATTSPRRPPWPRASVGARCPPAQRFPARSGHRIWL